MPAGLIPLRGRLALLLWGLLLAACGSATPATEGELPPPHVVQHTVTPPPSTTPTQTPRPSPTPSATATATAQAEAATATAASTQRPAAGSVTGAPAPTAGVGPAPTMTAPAAAPTAAPSPAAHTYSRPVIVANYVAWYDAGSWSAGCTSDSPAAGPYNSDDGATTARHVAEARRAGLDGFSVHWGRPGDRTDLALARVLAQGFGATATFLNHFFYGVASRSAVAANLSYLANTHMAHGSWIRYGGRPVLFFADMGRVDTSGGLSPQQAWESIRNAADPGRQAIWIAEGLDPAYLAVFDGLYVYRIDHDCCPYAYQSAGKWSGWVREAEKLYGPRYWVATIQPGWNDLLTANPACSGVRLSAAPFARDREGGAYYQRTAASALATAPDMIVVNSFNEWVEGSFVEPSAGFGDLYLTLTAQYAQQFRGSR